MRRPVLVVALTVIVMCGILTGVSACVNSSAGQGSPVVMCGTTVYGGGWVAFTFDVAQAGTIGNQASVTRSSSLSAPAATKGDT